MSDAGGELAADAAAVTAVGAVPGDDGAVVFECREGGASGEELSDPEESWLLTLLLSPPQENPR